MISGAKHPSYKGMFERVFQLMYKQSVEEAVQEREDEEAPFQGFVEGFWKWWIEQEEKKEKQRKMKEEDLEQRLQRAQAEKDRLKKIVAEMELHDSGEDIEVLQAKVDALKAKLKAKEEAELKAKQQEM